MLLTGFYFALFRDYDFTASTLGVINADVSDFSFVDQNGDTVTQKVITDKVYVAEYFFTTCKGICPKMNANMRRVFDVYKGEENFMILSHSCMPETDTVSLLKAYEQTFSSFFTDDASVVEKMARKIYLVPGNVENIKITTPMDLKIAEVLMK